MVGGLVPSLLIDQEAGDTALEPHVGTMDLDIGLAAALLDQGRYRELSDRLRRSGFSPDENETGNPTRQRWKFEAREKVTIDFLMPPTSPDDRGGSLRDLEPDFAAVIAPGLHLAFRDRTHLSLSGQTIVGEDATREIWVCGPGAFIVLKSLAFDLLGEDKDAYDLFYFLRNYRASLEDVVERLRPQRERRGPPPRRRVSDGRTGRSHPVAGEGRRLSGQETASTRSCAQHPGKGARSPSFSIRLPRRRDFSQPSADAVRIPSVVRTRHR